MVPESDFEGGSDKVVACQSNARKHDTYIVWQTLYIKFITQRQGWEEKVFIHALSWIGIVPTLLNTKIHPKHIVGCVIPNTIE